MYLFFLPLFACDDFLTVESENDVTYYSYFKTEQDVEAVITTMMAMEIDMWGSVMNVDVFDIAALPCDEYWNEDQRNLPDSILDHGRRVLGRLLFDHWTC